MNLLLGEALEIHRANFEIKPTKIVSQIRKLSITHDLDVTNKARGLRQLIGWNNEDGLIFCASVGLLKPGASVVHLSCFVLVHLRAIKVDFALALKDEVH